MGETKLHKHKPNDNAYINGKCVGFYRDNGPFIYLQRCPKCDLENYAISVSSGVCAWCGHDVNKGKEEK